MAAAWGGACPLRQTSLPLGGLLLRVLDAGTAGRVEELRVLVGADAEPAARARCAVAQTALRVGAKHVSRVQIVTERRCLSSRAAALAALQGRLGAVADLEDCLLQGAALQAPLPLPPARAALAALDERLGALPE